MILFHLPFSTVIGNQLSRNLYHDICFSIIRLLNIVEFLKYKTALVACLDFLHIVLETL